MSRGDLHSGHCLLITSHAADCGGSVPVSAPALPRLLVGRRVKGATSTPQVVGCHGRVPHLVKWAQPHMLHEIDKVVEAACVSSALHRPQHRVPFRCRRTILAVVAKTQIL